ncbi:hypothetical protein AKO67_23105, partial [Flavobacterium sp. VMW]
NFRGFFVFISHWEERSIFIQSLSFRHKGEIFANNSATIVQSLSSFSRRFLLRRNDKNVEKLGIKKRDTFCISFRGIVRIRTGVGAFAEPSLAARPRRHCLNGWQK